MNSKTLTIYTNEPEKIMDDVLEALCSQEDYDGCVKDKDDPMCEGCKPHKITITVTIEGEEDDK